MSIAKLHNELDVQIKRINSNKLDKKTFPLKVETEVNLLDIFKKTICENIFFFKSKEENFEILCLGLSKKLESEKELEEFIDKNPEAIVCAPLKFDIAITQTYIPEIAFIKHDSNLKVIFSKEDKVDFLKPINLFIDLKIDEALKPFEHFNIISNEDIPDFTSWDKMIDEAKNLFSQNILKKIVLSRRKHFSFSHNVESKEFFLKALSLNLNSHLTYSIYFQECFTNAFISFSPEELFKIQHNMIRSISLAGSTKRGQSLFEDQHYESQLTQDSKLLEEQKIVSQEIVKIFSNFSTNIDLKKDHVIKLNYIQHKANIISGDLTGTATIFEIIKNLHPTPAIGGWPKEKAHDYIKIIENYDRNFYAAPFGYITKDRSEFAVGIRSAQVNKNNISLFGGAGILWESDSEEEWNETRLKMTPLLRVFDHE